MYETFDHTADVGLRIREPDLDTLFATAGRALFSLIVANPDSIRAVQPTAIRIEGCRTDDLLFDWLAELLFTFDSRQTVFARFEVEVSDTRLTATAWGEPFDRVRHELEMEVKAITYHGLTVRPEPDGWLAEIIVDI